MSTSRFDAADKLFKLWKGTMIMPYAIGEAKLRALIEELRDYIVVTGRDEASVEFANGYETACEMAADRIELILDDEA